MVQILTARRNEYSDIDDLLQRIMIRMGGRGTPGPLTPVDQLLLWEILVDDAAAIPGTVNVMEEISRKTVNPRHRISPINKRGQNKRGRGYFYVSFLGRPLSFNVDSIPYLVAVSIHYLISLLSLFGSFGMRSK